MPAFHLTPTQWRRLRRTTQVLAWIAAAGLVVAAPVAPGWAILPAQLDPLLDAAGEAWMDARIRQPPPR